MSFTIEKAIGLANMFHEGQVDKAGKPYIYHLLRVMLKVSRSDRIPAVLHDILEDTPVTPSELEAWGVGRGDVESILMLSRPQGQTYREYIDLLVAAGTDRELRIKQADLIDHLYKNPHRLGIKSQSQTDRYTSALDKINFELFQRGRGIPETDPLVGNWPVNQDWGGRAMFGNDDEWEGGAPLEGGSINPFTGENHD